MICERVWRKYATFCVLHSKTCSYIHIICSFRVMLHHCLICALWEQPVQVVCFSRNDITEADTIHACFSSHVHTLHTPYSSHAFLSPVAVFKILLEALLEGPLPLPLSHLLTSCQLTSPLPLANNQHALKGNQSIIKLCSSDQRVAAKFVCEGNGCGNKCSQVVFLEQKCLVEIQWCMCVLLSHLFVPCFLCPTLAAVFPCIPQPSSLALYRRKSIIFAF